MPISVTMIGERCKPLAALPLERVGELAAHPDVLLWVDVTQPSLEELAALETTLALPSLAIEDAREAHQRPKVDHYEGCVVVAAYAAALDAPTAPGISFHELQLFVSPRWVVTIRQDPIPDVETIHRRVCTPGGPAKATATTLAYTVLDEVVDTYFGVLEHLQERIEEVDDAVWSRADDMDLTEAFALRRDLARFRRIVAPMREVLTVMVRREGGVLDDSADEHLRDLYDHSITVYEEIEMSRELLAAALEGHMSVVSNRLNSVVLRVSAWAAIIAVPTVIASIYGMNFRHMPELHWAFGYPFALVLMIACAVGLYLVFKRQRWL
jgi:magnesium transporter